MVTNKKASVKTDAFYIDYLQQLFKKLSSYAMFFKIKTKSLIKTVLKVYPPVKLREKILL
ncbi:hypothetical protein CQ022_05640 [Chryseobacterium culicis]|uniref:Uncharacterized protein n=1 Tax=Chryseobacterium culicis TaxID=680127 RepID=A0A2S9CZ46_CHRCI|nr:hypothetical protein CQ022_05640 [Chryseobacterium culicis]PRB90540.1 hypothetical protein CQ033_07345 [Chryseobacterium culicis]